MRKENAPIEHFDEIQRASLDQDARHANEVRLVAGLKDNDERRWYIEGSNGVRDNRGDEAADRLRRDVWELMQRGRAT